MLPGVVSSVCGCVVGYNAALTEPHDAMICKDGVVNLTTQGGPLRSMERAVTEATYSVEGMSSSTDSLSSPSRSVTKRACKLDGEDLMAYSIV